VRSTARHHARRGDEVVLVRNMKKTRYCNSETAMNARMKTYYYLNAPCLPCARPELTLMATICRGSVTSPI
jgi:hypothetical protein